MGVTSLPGLNGYEVAKRIRQNPVLKNIVLVASRETNAEIIKLGSPTYLSRSERYDACRNGVCVR
jgi:CheY-like chemotaxis protein